jgi:hypothetical protein
MREPKGTTFAAHIRRRHVRAHRTAHGLHIRQCQCFVPEPCGLPHEFLGMARSSEKGVVALHDELAPALPPGRMHGGCTPHRFVVMHGKRMDRSMSLR